ncbi:MAG: hypothetical protein ACT4OY_06265, partial [Alphaproteobacteria bacterium]
MDKALALSAFTKKLKHSHNQLSRSETGYTVITQSVGGDVYKYIAVLNSHMVAENGKEVLDISTIAKDISAAKVPSPHNIFPALQKNLPLLKAGEYIRVQFLEQEDIILLRPDDMNLVTDLKGGIATVIQGAKNMPEHINLATFRPNADLIFMALADDASWRSITVMLDGQRAVKIASSMQDYNFSDKRQGAVSLDTSIREISLGLQEEAFDSFMNGITDENFRRLSVEPYGDFFVTVGKHPEPVVQPFSVRAMQKQKSLFRGKDYENGRVWNSLSPSLREVNKTNEIGIIRDQSNQIEAYALPASYAKKITAAKLTVEELDEKHFVKTRTQWLAIMEPHNGILLNPANAGNEGIYILPPTIDGSFVQAISKAQVVRFLGPKPGGHQKTTAASQLGDVVASAEQNFEIIKHLKCFSLENFSKDIAECFLEINNQNIFKSIHNTEGKTIAVLAPLSAADYVGDVDKSTTLEDFATGVEQRLSDINEDSVFVVMKKGDSELGFILPASAEEAVVAELEDKDLIIERKPIEEVVQTPRLSTPTKIRKSIPEFLSSLRDNEFCIVPLGSAGNEDVPPLVLVNAAMALKIQSEVEGELQKESQNVLSEVNSFWVSFSKSLERITLLTKKERGKYNPREAGKTGVWGFDREEVVVAAAIPANFHSPRIRKLIFGDENFDVQKYLKSAENKPGARNGSPPARFTKKFFHGDSPPTIDIVNDVKKYEALINENGLPVRTTFRKNEDMIFLPAKYAPYLLGLGAEKEEYFSDNFRKNIASIRKGFDSQTVILLKIGGQGYNPDEVKMVVVKNPSAEIIAALLHAREVLDAKAEPVSLVKAKKGRPDKDVVKDEKNTQPNKPEAKTNIP